MAPHQPGRTLCSVAVGGSGVYIGAKDFLISEVLGGFSVTADSGASALREKGKEGGKVGRLTVQIGAHAAPPPPGCAPTATLQGRAWHSRARRRRCCQLSCLVSSHALA